MESCRLDAAIKGSKARSRGWRYEGVGVEKEAVKAGVEERRLEGRRKPWGSLNVPGRP
jgi:hypothetical protein